MFLPPYFHSTGIGRKVNMKRMWHLILVSVLILSCCLAFSLYGQEKKETGEVYTVKKGDTLWDISSKFLKNPYLWPKLWQRNPYITNPHWIYPGNPVRLNPLEEPKKEEPKKVVAEEKPKEVAREPEAKEVREVKKIAPPPEVSKQEAVVEQRPPAEKPLVFPEVRFAGFFSDLDFRGMGSVIDSREGKNLMAAGDICYVKFKTKDTIPIGEKFTTFSITDDPVTRDFTSGKRYNMTGIIQIIDSYGHDRFGHFYTAKVLESFQEISRGDSIMPYNKEKMEIGTGKK
jgi:hypothetical protein